MSAATSQRERSEMYQQNVDAVLLAFGTDARSGLSETEAEARREKIRQERVRCREAGSRVEKIPHTVSGSTGHPAADRDSIRQPYGCMNGLGLAL